MLVCAREGQGGIRCRGWGDITEKAPIEYSLGVAWAYLGLKPT